ncbi:hypothetical protein BDR26DRAFT_361261 [Obelidium mucronatum]|nr:hypothetical protein BDR26DRAFT_361261 [Obelidium mucronatum]
MQSAIFLLLLLGVWWGLANFARRNRFHTTGTMNLSVLGSDDVDSNSYIYGFGGANYPQEKKREQRTYERPGDLNHSMDTLQYQGTVSPQQHPTFGQLQAASVFP